jgi:hypothetical protein
MICKRELSRRWARHNSANLCLSVCMYVCMHVGFCRCRIHLGPTDRHIHTLYVMHVYTYLHAHLHTYIYICVYAMRIYVCMYVCMHVCVYVCLFISDVNMVTGLMLTRTMWHHQIQTRSLLTRIIEIVIRRRLFL